MILRNDHGDRGEVLRLARIRSAILLMLRTLVNSESAATGYERVRDAGVVGDEVAGPF